MTTFLKIASAALAVSATALLIPTAAMAQDDETVVRGERSDDAPVGYVTFRDINLASAEGQATLQSRVRRVARSICTTTGFKELAREIDERACRVAAVESAQPQIARVVERYRAGEFASLAPIAIVGVK
jgi:UrcA family protein